MITGRDLADYLQACKEADIRTFKRDHRLNKIFEHATYRQAKEYMNIINRQTSHLLNNKFTNDDYGAPTLCTIMGRVFSPSTLQYICVLSNLISQYGTLDNLNIVEIGGGYGGQCRTIMDVFKPACYHIIDLPEVCSLASRYCAAECFTEPTGYDYDLCISNYALSEIKDPTEYIDKVLRRSKHGYITCNTSFVNLDFPHRKLPDIDSEAADNYILVW